MILRDEVMAGHVEYDVVMVGEDVNGSEIDKRMGMRIGMIDGMIRMMFVVERSLQFLLEE